MEMKRIFLTEGAFCVWTYEELEKLLVKDGDRSDLEIFANYFNVLPGIFDYDVFVINLFSISY